MEQITVDRDALLQVLYALIENDTLTDSPDDLARREFNRKLAIGTLLYLLGLSKAAAQDLYEARERNVEGKAQASRSN